MSELIRYDVCDRVATVTLHRPDKRNALNHRLVAEPKGALAEAAAEAAVRVVAREKRVMSFALEPISPTTSS